MCVLELACDVTQHADVAAVVMQEGLAHICLVTPSMTLVRSKIETTIPRKRKGLCSHHDKVGVPKASLYKTSLQNVYFRLNSIKNYRYFCY